MPPKKTPTQLDAEIAGQLRRTTRGVDPQRLREEVDRHTREATAARYQLDRLTPPRPGQVLRRVDSLLSLAQDQIGRHLTTMETRVGNPPANQAGHDVFDAIEAVRRKIARVRLP